MLPAVPIDVHAQHQQHQSLVQQSINTLPTELLLLLEQELMTCESTEMMCTMAAHMIPALSQITSSSSRSSLSPFGKVGCASTEVLGVIKQGASVACY